MSTASANQAASGDISLHIVCAECDGKNRVPATKLAAGGRCGRCKAPLFQHKVVELTAANFHRHLQNDIPVLVDFWAPWCGPCQSFAPIFKQAAQALEPTIRCVKLDTEQAQAIAGQYQIRSIPTLMLFHHGREVARQSGAMSLPQLQQWLRPYL